MKLGAIIFLFVVGSTGLSLFYYYQTSRELVLSQMRNRIRDLAHTGSWMFQPEDRRMMRELSSEIHKRQLPIDDSIREMEDGDYLESLSQADIDELQATPEFKRIVQVLRQIRNGSTRTQRTYRPLPQTLLDQNDAPGLKYAYLLITVPDSPEGTYYKFLADSDYEAVDMNNNNQIDEDETPNPVGNWYRSDEVVFEKAFEGRIAAGEEWYEDGWGRFLSSGAPILDEQGNVIAVLGLDLDVKGEANRLEDLWDLCLTIIAVTAILAILISVALSLVLTRPINRLREGAERVSQRDFDTHIKVKSKDEFGLLAGAFNSMVAQIRDYARNLEDMVAQRTRELQETLGKVQALKLQQDGDYFLTNLLANPLFKNWNKSREATTEFYIRQKKTFEFRERPGELGGDLCISGNLRFTGGKRYTMFINADAMGKSMQGAGGALVMGTVVNSIMHRSAANDRVLDISPDEWLHQTYNELHSVFKSFDGSMAISCFMGLIEDSTGLMHYFNAEHPHTVLLRNGRASFIEEESYLSKIGLELRKPDVIVRSFQLEPGDILIVGSDGRDDLRLPHLKDKMNEDETLFLRSVEESGGELDKLVERIMKQGTLTDDLSLIRVGFQEKTVHHSGQDDRELFDTIATQIRERDYTAALARLDKLSTERTGLLYHYYRGLCLSRLDRLGEALEELEVAARMNRDQAAVPALLGNLHYKRKDFSRAREYWQEALNLNPDNVKLQTALKKLEQLNLTGSSPN
ncbi:MAG: SpoIIE family protein phosphatase [Leptospiraceae bacterium]|nr:SpoIIE family protein phosphatase [Leptospiraceae bacterium]MCB1315442.1 SpoIIE family protein phosphatase [Leptospiraceae bacterium]